MEDLTSLIQNNYLVIIVFIVGLLVIKKVLKATIKIALLGAIVFALLTYFGINITDILGKK